MTTSRSIAIVGYGKMGKAIESLALQGGWTIAGKLDQGWRDDPASVAVLKSASVAVEFTEPAEALANIRAIVEAGCPVVVGTTGWYDELERVTGFVQRLEGRLFWSPNFSIGAQMLMSLARTAGALAKRAGTFDAHIVETHHSAKKDAPSGTAIKIGEAAESTMERGVPITSIRTGHEPGKHELVFDALFEQLRLVHVARDRRVFAAGALLAADWLRERRNSRGVFTMQDLLQSPGDDE